MSRSKPTVLSAIKAALPRGARLLLGVSGGADSTALLHGCFSLSRLYRLHLEVAHVNHKLRASSHRDAQFVEELCDKYGIRFHLKSDARPPKKRNKEAWGRELRYKFFSEILKRQKLDWVLTAHNADDVVETLLMRLLANKELSNIQERDLKRKLIRPLLTVNRAAILQYIKSRRLEFVEDETNFDTDFIRNRIRHKLIPHLKENFGAQIVDTLSEQAIFLALDHNFIYSQGAEIVVRMAAFKFGSRQWFKELRHQVQSVDSALGFRVLQELFLDKLGFKLGRRHAQALLKFVIGSGAQIELPSGVVVRRSGGGIAIKSGS